MELTKVDLLLLTVAAPPDHCAACAVAATAVAASNFCSRTDNDRSTRSCSYRWC